MNTDQQRSADSTTNKEVEALSEGKSSERELKTTDLGDAATETKGGYAGQHLDGGGGYLPFY
jgi:hypothetical protein